MAVADVFTAITENRPYRLGMSDIHAVKVLENMVESGALDKNVVNVLKDNFQMINELREVSQEEAASRYEKFLHIEI
jgi:HD-GYP domain-containing protein (c-di-GMP phosphodiesterase class II)